MDDKNKPKTTEETKTGSCCNSEASKDKDAGKFDYRPKEHGENATRRKGCC